MVSSEYSKTVDSRHTTNGNRPQRIKTQIISKTDDNGKCLLESNQSETKLNCQTFVVIIFYDVIVAVAAVYNTTQHSQP